MENKNELLSHEKPSQDRELERAQRSSCSPDLPIHSPERPITCSPAREGCRECLGALAHRLAQPMTALRGGIELGLMGKRTVTEYRALLEQSLQLADSMVQMIVSLRDLGESSAPGGNPQSVSLEKMVSEVLAELESQAQDQHLRLELDAGEAIRVSADPTRLREALETLFAWIVQNCAEGGVTGVKLSAGEGVGRVLVSPPRLDLQYLQIKMLADITTPGQLFSHASKNGALGWAIHQRLFDGLGGKLEVLIDGSDTGRVCVSLPLAPTG
jgi:light-regulated signal transduction histidine kinase (bacteriophytochrome)